MTKQLIGGYLLISLAGIDVKDGGTIEGLGEFIYKSPNHKFVVLSDIVVNGLRKKNLSVMCETSLTYTEQPDDWNEEEDGVFVPEPIYSATIKNVYGYDLSIVNDTITPTPVVFIVTADDIDSGEATEGQVLLADGEGGADWGSVPLDVSQLLGKFVRIISAPTSATITQEEYNDFLEGVFINGTFLNHINPIVFPSSRGGNATHFILFGFKQRPGALSAVEFVRFKVDLLPGSPNYMTPVVEDTYLSLGVEYNHSVEIYGKPFPSYPSDKTKDYSLVQNADADGTLAWKEIVNNIAPVFSDATTYAENDLVLYEGALYKCSNVAGHTGAWDSADFTRTTLAEVIASL